MFGRSRADIAGIIARAAIEFIGYETEFDVIGPIKFPQRLKKRSTERAVTGWVRRKWRGEIRTSNAPLRLRKPVCAKQAPLPHKLPLRYRYDLQVITLTGGIGGGPLTR
jgi:hypothetical protein